MEVFPRDPKENLMKSIFLCIIKFLINGSWKNFQEIKLLKKVRNIKFL